MAGTETVCLSFRDGAAGGEENQSMEVRTVKYADRQGNRWEEKSLQDRFLEKMYGSRLGRAAARVLAAPMVSRIGGRLLETRASRLLIPGFVKRNRQDPGEWEARSFASFNDFFTRKAAPGMRPQDPEEDVLISPCDGRLLVSPVTGQGRFLIKHTGYTVAQLLRSHRLARRFYGGWALIFRLTVQDYHRFCYVDDAARSSTRRIAGCFHTVNPAANDAQPIYKENTREYCLLHTRHFGTVLMMEVGALLVGKIENYHGAGTVRRGQEKGRFAFGGSTVVLLVEPGKVMMDRDILENSRDGFETLVKMGQRIGKAAG